MADEIVQALRKLKGLLHGRGCEFESRRSRLEINTSN